MCIQFHSIYSQCAFNFILRFPSRHKFLSAYCIIRIRIVPKLNKNITNSVHCQYTSNSVLLFSVYIRAFRAFLVYIIFKSRYSAIVPKQIGIFRILIFSSTALKETQLNKIRSTGELLDIKLTRNNFL